MNTAILLLIAVFGYLSWEFPRYIRKQQLIAKYRTATELIFICSEDESDKGVHERAEWHRGILKIAENDLNAVPGSWNIQVIEIIYGFANHAGESWEMFEQRKLEKIRQMVNQHHIAMYEKLGEEEYKFKINKQRKAKEFNI